ncbi:acyl-[acyl-carrier-protein] thioesterase [Flavobacterium arcticum]|uniref:Acyl-[acyl-carrier-protein] thioesterase n=1 Tax=Flavobacterium arcticum TaxID=1784713 RepID=A0A345HCM9_9FLAO|nr:acyl-ACP thioesterase domain-containing protein [Flavobacterium arcticum]AXG74339.1 acyl-[acyl-carrier-protein] thioesterase [Flavobacterium arcticum]KAF2507547.1 acyl-[acyl-carrier-protein] thioesterase [Flavobacterium arcticum]
MPITENFTSTHSEDWEINFLQCNPNGYLRQTELCNLLQLTAGAHSEIGGMSFTDMQVHDQAWVLSRMRVEIDEMPKWRDVVTVKTWIMDLQGSRSVRALEMWMNGKKIIGAITYWAVFNTKLRKPEALALPHEHFEKYPNRMPTKASFVKIDLNRDTVLAGERKVVLSDLDIVFHVNNVKYLEWCLDAIDYRPLLKQQLQSFDMNFLRELKLEDSVTLNKGREDKTEFFTVVKEGKPCFALELNWK